MTTWFVTRHAGAAEWARRRGLAATIVAHLDPAKVQRGDAVIGTLPAQLAADVEAHGGRYVHLVLDLAEADRGRDLSADEMDAAGARLEAMSVRRLGAYRPGADITTAAPVGSPESVWERARRAARLRLTKCRRWIARRRGRALWTIGLSAAVLLALPTFMAERGEVLWGCIFGTGCTATAAWLNLAGITGAGVVYGIVFLVIAALVRTVVWSRMRILAPRDARCRVLISGLSVLKPNEEERLPEITETFAGRGALFGLPTTDYLAQETLGPPEVLQRLAVPWQQTVRAALGHGAALERLLVLPSEESLGQFERFAALMKALLPELPVELIRGEDGDAFRLPDLPGEPPRSYEDYAYVWSGLSLALDRLHDEPHADGRTLGEADVCIDVTAGTKTFSIAAANLTLNRELKLSYVGNDGRVTVYNAELGSADSLTGTLNTAGAGL